MASLSEIILEVGLGKVSGDLTDADVKVTKEREPYTFVFSEVIPLPVVSVLSAGETIPQLVLRCLESTFGYRFPRDVLTLDHVNEFFADGEKYNNVRNIRAEERYQESFKSLQKWYMQNEVDDEVMKKEVVKFFNGIIWTGFLMPEDEVRVRRRIPAPAPRAMPVGTTISVAVEARGEAVARYTHWDRFAGRMHFEIDLDDLRAYLGVTRLRADEVDRDDIAGYLREEATRHLIRDGIDGWLEFDDTIDTEYLEHVEDDQDSIEIEGDLIWDSVSDVMDAIEEMEGDE